jgi:enoyl-CoA hydratase
MSLVEFTKQDSIGHIVLNDENNLNAMSVAMGLEFKKLMGQISRNKTLRVVTLTGAGRAFSSGGNLDMILGLMGRPKAETARKLQTFYKMFLTVRDIPQIVIAAINGHAVGAGFCLAMACDLKYASDSAKMGANFARIGFAPGMAGTSLMTRLAGPVHAAEILMTGKIFNAPTALNYGLINQVLPATELSSHVLTIAGEIAQNAPLPLRQIKKGIQLAQNKSLEQMFNYDAKMQAQIRQVLARQALAAHLAELTKGAKIE